MLHIHQIQRGMHPLGELLRIIISPEVHEEEVRSVTDHMTMKCRHLDAMLSQGPQYRVDLTCDHDKIASDGRFPAAGRLENDASSGSHRRCHAHTPFGYCFPARHAELVDTSAHLPLVTERQVQRCRIQVHPSSFAGRGARGCHWSLALRKSRMQRFSELDGIAMPTYMHIEDRHRGAELMVVHRSDFDITCDQPRHDRTDLRISQHQITHEHGAGAAGLKGYPAA